jgi:hypothetical protein
VGETDALTIVGLVEYHVILECYQGRRVNFGEHLARQLSRCRRFLLGHPGCRSGYARKLRVQLIPLRLSTLVADFVRDSREESTPVILAMVLTASITSPGSSS